MSGRAGQAAVPARLATAAPTGLLGASLGVLGWLLTQAATYGVAEHTHLTADGVTSHRHGYAFQLAAGAGLVALLAVLLLLVVHLTSSSTSSGQQCSVRAARGPQRSVSTGPRLAPAVAALTFVGVGAVELSAAGTPALAAGGVLAVGAALQMLAAVASAALATTIRRSIERLALSPATGAWSPGRWHREVAPRLSGMVEAGRDRVWDGRAPPVCWTVLVPSP
jgi:hypothetical protein